MWKVKTVSWLQFAFSSVEHFSIFQLIFWLLQPKTFVTNLLHEIYLLIVSVFVLFFSLFNLNTVCLFWFRLSVCSLHTCLSLSMQTCSSSFYRKKLSPQLCNSTTLALTVLMNSCCTLSSRQDKVCMNITCSAFVSNMQNRPATEPYETPGHVAVQAQKGLD